MKSQIELQVEDRPVVPAEPLEFSEVADGPHVRTPARSPARPCRPQVPASTVPVGDPPAEWPAVERGHPRDRGQHLEQRPAPGRPMNRFINGVDMDGSQVWWKRPADLPLLRRQAPSGSSPIVRHRAPAELLPERLVVRFARHFDQSERDRRPADGHPVPGMEPTAILAVHDNPGPFGIPDADGVGLVRGIDHRAAGQRVPANRGDDERRQLLPEDRSARPTANGPSTRRAC